MLEIRSASQEHVSERIGEQFDDVPVRQNLEEIVVLVSLTSAMTEGRAIMDVPIP